MSEQSGRKRHRFGLTRSGGAPALHVAIPVGLLIAIVVGITKVMFGNPDGPYKWLAGVFLGVFLAPCIIGLVWVAIVDRSTLPDAVSNPVDSVENVWNSRAAIDTFHVIIAVCGIGASFSVWWNSVVSVTLIAVFLTAAFVFVISYIIHKSHAA